MTPEALNEGGKQARRKLQLKRAMIYYEAAAAKNSVEAKISIGFMLVIHWRDYF